MCSTTTLQWMLALYWTMLAAGALCFSCCKSLLCKNKKNTPYFFCDMSRLCIVEVYCTADRDDDDDNDDDV